MKEQKKEITTTIYKLKEKHIEKMNEFFSKIEKIKERNECIRIYQ